MTFEHFLDAASLGLLGLLASIIAAMVIGGMLAGVLGAGDDFPD